MTSRHGDHAAACLKELSLPFKLLVIEKNPSVSWLKYDFNVNKPGIFAIHFYFLYFFNANDDHDIFFNSRIRFLVRSDWFLVSTPYRYQNLAIPKKFSIRI